jgi:hypothetical protein
LGLLGFAIVYLPVAEGSAVYVILIRPWDFP